MILKGREEIDDIKRTEIYHQLEKVLQSNYEDVWLWWPNAVRAHSKKGGIFKPCKGDTYQPRATPGNALGKTLQ
ncbi:hypothetical protein MHK_007159 [Candidatus Magnetomorum sp. HK-1]|nr:hypothetical protein MHK_007159 [Candidatus Magnetomorum sp. HK-1]